MQDVNKPHTSLPAPLGWSTTMKRWLGFLQVCNYKSGFNQGHLVSWPDSVVYQGEVREVARTLAASLNTDVLLELTDGSGQWLLTTPHLEESVASVVMLDDGIDTAE
jgi:hypothetical protein